MKNDNDLGTHWPVPRAVTYIEVADRLLLMAAQAKSIETQLQFEQLAKLYEKLAATAVHSSGIATTAHRLISEVVVASPIRQH
jgi:hypothetical protein